MASLGGRLLAVALLILMVPACTGSGGSSGGNPGGGQPPPGSTGWTLSSANPVLTPGGSSTWDFWGVFYPSVSIEPTGSATPYVMWYEGYTEFFTAVPTGIAIIGGISYLRAIGSATSSDGLVWTKSGTNPVLSAGAAGAWDEGGVGTPCVMPADRMWYTGWGLGAISIGLATWDGGTMSWRHSPSPVLSPDPSPAWDSAGVLSPCVLFDGSKFRMWYASGVSERDPGIGIGTAESSDGISWSKSSSNPILVPGSAGMPDQDGVGSAWVVLDGSTYRMWYAGWKGGAPSLCTATSTDGISWIKDSGNPVLSGGPTGSWDSQGLYTPCVRQQGATFRMWMGGLNNALLPQIGYATNP